MIGTLKTFVTTVAISNYESPFTQRSKTMDAAIVKAFPFLAVVE
jgi:hypothetical protein